MRRNYQFPFPANFKTDEAKVPTSYFLTGSTRHFKGLTSIIGAIKFCTVLKRPFVMNQKRVADFRSRSRAFDNIIYDQILVAGERFNLESFLPVQIVSGTLNEVVDYFSTGFIHPRNHKSK